MTKALPTAERLRELLDYDPATGVFRWRKITSVRVKVGDVAGRVDAHGYHIIGIDGQEYKAHRLAWVHHYGQEPVGVVDHRDTVRTHNWVGNLRDTTQRRNLQNASRRRTNKSGFKGVSWHRRAGKWMVQIKGAGPNRYLGLYADLHEAAAVYASAAREQFGEFARAA